MSHIAGPTATSGEPEVPPAIRPGSSGAEHQVRRTTHRRPDLSTLVGLAVLVLCVWTTVHTTDMLFTRQDANYDLKSYHAYTGWAVFNGGLDHDLHPAPGSYLNPPLDVLNYVAVSLLDAHWGSALLIAIQLTVLIPLYLIARLLLPLLPPFAAAGIAALGVGGALVTSEWGTTFNDLTNSVPVTWGLWALLSCIPESRRRIVVGGALFGAATALKLTTAPFAVAAVILAVVMVPRFTTLLRVGLGLGCGFLLAGGPWMVVMWREFRNPFFPLLNNVFDSPYAPEAGIESDSRFGPQGLGGLLFLPFKLVAAPAGLTGELPSSDWRWPLWALSVVVLAVLFLLTWRTSPLGADVVPREWTLRSATFRRVVAVQTWCVVSYALWAVIFGIQRYAIPLELVLPAVLLATVFLLLPRRLPQLAVVAAVALGLGATTVTIDWGRVDMPPAEAIGVGSLPYLQRYDAVVVATGPITNLAVATGGSREDGTRPSWLSYPTTQADAERGLELVDEGRVGILIRTDVPDARTRAAEAAATFGLTTTGECTEIPAPLSERAIICETNRSS